MQGIYGWSGWETDGDRQTEAARSMDAAVEGYPGAAPAEVRGADSLIGLAGGDALGVAEEGGLLVAVTGRPRWHDAELQKRAAAVGAARVLLDQYRSRDKAVLEALTGPYTLAVIDAPRRQVLLAVDRMGMFPLFYAREGRRLVFASSTDALSAHPLLTKTADPQQLFNYGYFHMVPTPGTVYRGFHRLPPGHHLTFSGDQTKIEAHWRPVFREHERTPQAALKQEFRAALHAGVARAVGDDAAAGTFLSGGTDSSTITGVLSEVSGPGVRTYSIGFEAEGYDEMEYARIAARHFKTDHHEYYVTPDDVVEAIPLIAQAYDQPYGNSSAIPTYYCSRLAREDGVTVLLGGDGGDELFGGNARYAKQRVFELYGRVPSALRRGVIEPLLSALPERAARLPGVSKLHSYVTQAAVPMPQRIETYNLVHRLGTETLFTGDFLAQVDTQAPLKLLDDVYRSVHARNIINRMLALDFDFTLTDNDLPKVTRMAQLAGVEARFPMLDDELVDFSLRLPPRLKVRGTQLRWFFKESLRDFLPEAIITKSKHGFGLPFGPWLQTHKPLQDLVFDALGGLKGRGIFRADFIDRSMNTYLHSHPGYYGAVIWVMMMLELWFRYHVDGTGRAGDPSMPGHSARVGV